MVQENILVVDNPPFGLRPSLHGILNTWEVVRSFEPNSSKQSVFGLAIPITSDTFKLVIDDRTIKLILDDTIIKLVLDDRRNKLI